VSTDPMLVASHVNILGQVQPYANKVLYAYSLPDSTSHVGLLKIGDTTLHVSDPSGHITAEEVQSAARKRIQEQVGTSGMRAQIEWAVLVQSDPNKVFRDYAIHELLRRNGINPVSFTHSTAREWFAISADKAFEIVSNYLKGNFNVQSAAKAITLREEQMVFIDDTFEAWLNEKISEYLWDAKMRFGKTITALSLIQKSLGTDKPMLRTLILSHRPVVESSWFEDFKAVFADVPDIQFGSANFGLKWDEIDQNKPFIFFGSVQDFRGKDGLNQFKQKNAELFNIDWNVTLFDEAHEGLGTALAQEMIAALKTEFTLFLSGTPMNLLNSGRFVENQVSSWSYVDEQKAKLNWDYSIGQNPYEGLATMHMYTYDIRENIKTVYMDEEKEGGFSFAKLFSVLKGKFVHEADVKQFLNVLVDSDADDAFMPYSSQRVEATRHSLWTLPSVAACASMDKLLAEDPFFKDYTVVVVAGDDDSSSATPLNRVNNAIGDNPLQTKTITLTVGRLTTGVNVPAWSAVLMMNDIKSAAVYMQTIFRCQTPAYFSGKMKTDAYVWDFATDRALEVFSEVAGTTPTSDSSKALQEGKLDALVELTKFLPIVTRTGAKDLTALDAVSIVRELKSIYTERVIESGFESRLIFTQHLETLDPDVQQALALAQTINAKNTASYTKVEKKTTLAIGPGNGFELASKRVLEKKLEDTSVKIEDTTDSVQLAEEKKAIQAELKRRESLLSVLRTIGARLPYLIFVLMGDESFRKNKLEKTFNLSDLVDMIDEESWKEFFGEISKELVKTLEPAFNQDILMMSTVAWMEKIDGAYVHLTKGDYEEYTNRFVEMLGKIRNPDKETVFTPYKVIDLIYQSAGLGVDSPRWDTLVSTATPPTFYDINAKSGLFPVYAAVELKKAYDRADRHMSFNKVMENSVFTNTRTKAAAWATEAALNLPAQKKLINGKETRYIHDNITTIDVVKMSKSIQAWNKQPKATRPDDFIAIHNIHVWTGQLLRFANIGFMRTRGFQNSETIVELAKEINKVAGELLTLDDSSMVGLLNSLMVRMQSMVAEENVDLTFDYVISNPPYQESLVAASGKAKPIWDDFVFIAVEIAKHIAIINPARWQKGGQGTGLTNIKNYFFNSGHLESFVNVPTEDVFPTAGIGGGVCIELIDTTQKFENPQIGTWSEKEGWSELRNYDTNSALDIPLAEIDADIVLRVLTAALGPNFEKELWVGGENNELKKITSNPTNRGGDRRNYTISGQRLVHDRDYFISAEEVDSTKEYVKVYYQTKNRVLDARFVPLEEFKDTTRNKACIPKWKILIPKTGANFLYRNLGPTGEPNSLSTNTWLCRSFESEKEVIGFQSYMQTYFYRYLVGLRNVTHNAYANVHRFVPDLKDVVNPRTGKKGYDSDWIDDDLRILYAGVLTDEDWKHIKATAIAFDGGRGNYEDGWTFPDGTTRHSLSI
jgi:superfamily II DNA or RNA helicase